MAYILHIESATSVCSVCLAENDTVIASAENQLPNSHATHLIPMIQNLMNETQHSLSDLDAICISAGPGSYTGLRIGLSSAKGLCYALNIPLIAVSTLDSLAAVIKSNLKDTNAYICTLLEAKRKDVFYALYDVGLNKIINPQFNTLDENFLEEHIKHHIIACGGNGAEKLKGIVHSERLIVLNGIQCRADGMLKIAFQKFQRNDFENSAYFIPSYLKDFYFPAPKQK